MKEYYILWNSYCWSTCGYYAWL